MSKKLLLSLLLTALLSSVCVAQNINEATKPAWQKSVNGYVWVGSCYWASIVMKCFDDRHVVQGGVNLVLQKRGTSISAKTWFSLSPEQNAAGKRWTGDAQEFDLGGEVAQAFARGWMLKAGYSHFFITKSAGSDVEMILLAVSKEIPLTEKNKLVGAFEFYQFVPTSAKGPAAGRFYLPSIMFIHSTGNWTASAGITAAFNSAGVFGFKSEPAMRVNAQLLYKLPNGMKVGPDFVYGGAPGSSQRGMVGAAGVSLVF